MITLSSKLSIFISMLMAFMGCSFNKHHAEKNFIDPDEFVFLEYYQTQEGEVISGTAPHGRRIDGPTYRFDKATKKLDFLRKVDFSIDSVKVILGNGKILKGASGSGLSMRINAINKLPYTLNNLTISNVNGKGIYLIFDKKKLLLKAGDEWQTSTVSIDTIKTGSLSIVKTTTTHSIRYHGKLEKKGVNQ